jgi:hypothetical protein
MADEGRDATAMRRHSDINGRRVVLGGVAIALGVVATALVAYFLWQRWSATPGAPPPGGPNAAAIPAIAPPVLQAAPQQERAQYFAEKQRLLESWEWVDKRAGIARIPIEEAMQITAARGGDGAAASSKEQR